MTSSLTNPLHLYRSLLRETTYLFDSNARQYLHKYITSSFRSKISNSRTSSQHLPDYDGSILADKRHQLKRGRKFLSTLQKANQGYLRPLENVLNLTYGRKGRRRRELMTELMLREPDEILEQKAALDGKGGGVKQQQPVQQFAKGWKPPPKFDALLRSQVVLQSHLTHNKKIKTKPTLGENNAWGKPMPECRIRNATKRWYAQNARLLLPPLSEKEWQNIKARTEGDNLVIPKRRSQARIRVFTPEDDMIFDEESGTDLVSGLIAGPAKHKTVRQKRLAGNPHKLKPRFLKRFYARTVLRNTPVVIADPVRSVITFKWELGQNKVSKTVRLADEAHNSRLFD